MIEQGIRGGICQPNKKHIKANNKYMANYVKNALSLFIMYLDANNLYGLAMSKKLPYKKFEWNTSITEQDILYYDEESKVGYILKVDLRISKRTARPPQGLPITSRK